MTTSSATHAMATDRSLAGGGEMGVLIRAYDWSNTNLGPISDWPHALRTAVSICLNSCFPVVLWWGKSFTMLYNDAFRAVLGHTKHPGSLGRPARECWSEIWDVIGPMLEGVLETGEPTWSEDLLLIMDRNSPREEVYFTFSYSPIKLDDGTVGGIFCACTETTERVIRERRLLKDANQRKDEFLAMLAHELRNPLASIQNAVQIFGRLIPAVPELQMARDMIERQVRHLIRLVDDLLDVSRITQGKVALHKERVNLNDAVLAAIETNWHLVDSRHHRLETNLAVPTPIVEGDAIRLAQVFGNLLNNAAKYTEEGGWILVTSEADGNDVVVRIKDNGIGLPVEVLPRIFDPFTQADRSLDRSQGGLGIGLSLVKRLVKLHGGTVEAYSAGGGQGSEFVVRLPIAPAENPRVVSWPCERLPVRSRRARILVVDDNEDSAEGMAVLLQLQGHEVQRAQSGPVALEAARVFFPHIVLLDIGLPGMDGLEVARHMRKMPETKQCAIVAVTGYDRAEDLCQSQEAGIDYHLAKPVDLDTLKAIIASIELTRERSGDMARPAA